MAQFNMAATFWGSFDATRSIMKEREDKLAWAALEPQLSAQMQEAQKPLQEAEAAFQAAKTPEEKAAALSGRMAATRDFAMTSVITAAKLAASGNPHAMQYSKQLQEGVSQYAQLEMQGAQTLLQAQGQQQQRDVDQQRAVLEDARYGAQQEESRRRFDVEQGQHTEEMRLHAQERSQDLAFKERQDAREGKLAEGQLAIQGTEAETARLRAQTAAAGGDLSDRLKTTMGLAEQLAKGEISPEYAKKQSAALGTGDFLQDGKFDISKVRSDYRRQLQSLNDTIESSPSEGARKTAIENRDRLFTKLGELDEADQNIMKEKMDDPRGFLEKIMDSIAPAPPPGPAAPVSPTASGRNSLPGQIDLTLPLPTTDARGRPIGR